MISLCSTIYISHPGFSRVKSSSPLLDKMYIMDLSFYRQEGNMQKNIKHDMCDILMHATLTALNILLFFLYPRTDYDFMWIKKFYCLTFRNVGTTKCT